jgi:hypothetical protein
MTPWRCLIGLMSLLLLIIPNPLSLGISVVLLSALAFSDMWSGMTKVQQVEKDYIGWALLDFAIRSEQERVAEAHTTRARHAMIKADSPFDEFNFYLFVQERVDPREVNQSEQTAPRCDAHVHWPLKRDVEQEKGNET